MANEAVIIELNNNNPVRFTVADGTPIEKGALLKISADPRTVAASTEDAIFAGIAAAEKVADDGQVSLALHVPGQNNIFDLTCGATGVTLGQMVKLSGANLICDAVDTDYEAGKVIGRALETGAASEVVAVLV